MTTFLLSATRFTWSQHHRRVDQRLMRGNFGLTRLARVISDRQAVPFEYAAWHGWETRHIARGTWAFRDPRFGQLTAARTALVPASPGTRTWAQAAISGRIRGLGTPGPAAGTRGRSGGGRDGRHRDDLSAAL